MAQGFRIQKFISEQKGKPRPSKPVKRMIVFIGPPLPGQAITKTIRKQEFPEGTKSYTLRQAAFRLARA